MVWAGSTRLVALEELGEALRIRGRLIQRRLHATFAKAQRVLWFGMRGADKEQSVSHGLAYGVEIVTFTVTVIPAGALGGKLGTSAHARTLSADFTVLLTVFTL